MQSLGSLLVKPPYHSDNIIVFHLNKNRQTGLLTMDLKGNLNQLHWNQAHNSNESETLMATMHPHRIRLFRKNRFYQKELMTQSEHMKY